MKRIFLISGLLMSGLAFAQKNANIQLKNGQEIKLKTELKQNMSLSMGMEIKSEAESKYAMKVTKENPQAYEIEGQLDKLKIKAEAMGNNQHYDSDSAAHKGSEIGRSLGGLVGKKGVYSISRASGDVSVIKAPDVDSAALAAAMAGGMGGDLNLTVETAIKTMFFPSMAGHKVGDKWTDSSTTDEGLKTISNFEMLSVSGNTAKVKVNSLVNGTIKREAQGMEMDLNMKTVNTGDMEVNTVSYLVLKSKINSKIDGVMTMMGQDITMTGTVDIESKVD